MTYVGMVVDPNALPEDKLLGKEVYAIVNTKPGFGGLWFHMIDRMVERLSWPGEKMADNPVLMVCFPKTGRNYYAN